MKIREATADDASAIATLHTESWARTYVGTLTQDYLDHVAPKEREEVWRERFLKPKPDQVVLLAQVEGKSVGFVCAYLDGVNDWGAFIDNLHVSHPYQGRGIGKALLQSIAQKCLSSHANRGLCLSVNQSNTKAQKFYLRMGAQNAKEDRWKAPDGNLVPIYWFVWSDLAALAQNDAQRSPT